MDFWMSKKKRVNKMFWNAFRVKQNFRAGENSRKITFPDKGPFKYFFQYLIVFKLFAFVFEVAQVF